MEEQELTVEVKLSSQLILRLAMEAHVEDMKLSDYMRRILQQREKGESNEQKKEAKRKEVQEGSVRLAGSGKESPEGVRTGTG